MLVGMHIWETVTADNVNYVLDRPRLRPTGTGEVLHSARQRNALRSPERGPQYAVAGSFRLQLAIANPGARVENGGMPPVERDLIAWLRERLPHHARLLVGPGDDAAIVDLAGAVIRS